MAPQPNNNNLNLLNDDNDNISSLYNNKEILNINSINNLKNFDDDLITLNKLEFIYIKALKNEKRPKTKGWNLLTQSQSINKNIERVGYITGKVSNVTVLDIDFKDNGITYFKNFCKENNIDWENDYIYYTTPSGGMHYLFKYDERFSTKSKLYDELNNIIGIDIRNENGFAMCPPTLNYEWVNHPDDFGFDLCNMPESLINLLLKNSNKKKISYRKTELTKVEINNNDNNEYACKYTLKHFDLLLKNLNILRFDDYENWKNIAMILKFHLDDSGFDLFNKYSKLSKKYIDLESCKKFYNEIKNNNENQLTIGTLIFYLEKDLKKDDYLNIISQIYDKDIDIKIDNSNLNIHYHDYYDFDNNKIWEFNELLVYFKQRIFYLENSQCFYIRKLIIENRLDKKTKKNFTYKYIDYIPVKDVYTDNKKIFLFNDYAKIPLNIVVKNFFKEYISIKDVVFKPYSIKYKSKIDKRELNLYYDVNEHSYNKNFKIDMNLIQIILNHIKIVISNNDEKLNDYIINYICHKLQMPFSKTECCLLLHSIEQGTGKTAFYHLIQKLFGPRYVNDSSISELQKSFNSLYSRCLFVILEETEKGLSKNVNDFLKKAITQKTIREEEKFMKPIILEDHREIMILTNNFDTIKLDNQDRRYCCINVSNCKKNNREHFNQFYDFIENPNCMIHLYHYFINKDIINYDPRNIIETEMKKEMIQEHEDGIVSFVKYINEKIESDDGLFKINGIERIQFNDDIQSSDLHLMYKKYVKDHLTYFDDKNLIKFGKEIKIYYTSRRKGNGVYYTINKYDF